ncbi:MAG: PaaI family thioesterase [Deltaproteobacteria bacterium]|nr:PaaI family thioesterase [Deltaproteobacteria bacterium]
MPPDLPPPRHAELVHEQTCFACSGGSDLRNRFTYDPEQRTAHGDTVFGPGCQGAPGLAHGGAVFTILDEVMGTACWLSGLPVMTGRATIHYKQPVPLNVPIRSLGRIVSIDGKKVHVHGELYGPDGLCAFAEGLFIRIDGRYHWPVRFGKVGHEGE